MPQNPDGDGCLLTSMDCSQLLADANEVVQEIVLNQYAEMKAAIMMIEGHLPTQQELLDFGKILYNNGTKTFVWRGKPLLRFDEPVFTEEDGDDVIHQPVHYLFKIEECM